MIGKNFFDIFEYAASEEIDCFISCIEDLLDNEKVQEMNLFTQHGDTSTYEHCLMVSFRSFHLCKRLNLDYRAAARGGLLHDLFLYDWHDKNSRSSLHGFYHPGIALRNADKLFILDNKEKEIIRKHMWPLTVVPPKCREAYIICYFDKVCTLKEVMNEWGKAIRKMAIRSRVTARRKK